jgi:hypothetical protein
MPPDSRRLVFAFLCLGALPASAFAQLPPATVDVVMAVDGVHGSTPRRDTELWFDAFAAVRVSRDLDVVVRPVISRRAFDGAWQRQLYQLGVRYERRPGRARGLGLRLEVGQLPMPMGIGMLENRADQNPVVSQHSAYYFPLPRVDPEIPRTYLLAGAYPFGAQGTVSARRWDARLAVIDSSPVRGRSFWGSPTTPRLMNVVAGGGFTPRVGLRLGGAIGHGAYVSEHEVRDRSKGDRQATLVQVEGEWSFGYTRIVGEFIRGVMETARADAKTGGFWVEATQTLTPRFFLAGRADSQRFDYQSPASAVMSRQRYERFESILGFRLTPDLTFRGGYLVRKGYVVSHWDDQAIASIVWQRRLR